MTDVPILRVDWDRFASCFPDVVDELADRAFDRGRRVLAADDPGGGAGRLEALRHELARRVGSVGLLRFELVSQRARFARAERREQATYERHLQLDKDVVPPLKLEAQRLRAEVRDLEARAREVGIDVDGVEPRIDWDTTIAVDTYRPPRYESNAERRRAAVEFFRRVGGT